MSITGANAQEIERPFMTGSPRVVCSFNFIPAKEIVTRIRLDSSDLSSVFGFEYRCQPLVVGLLRPLNEALDLYGSRLWADLHHDSGNIPRLGIMLNQQFAIEWLPLTLCSLPFALRPLPFALRSLLLQIRIPQFAIRNRVAAHCSLLTTAVFLGAVSIVARGQFMRTLSGWSNPNWFSHYLIFGPPLTTESRPN